MSKKIKQDELYQCPYSAATKCALQDPCLGCEEFSVYLREK